MPTACQNVSVKLTFFFAHCHFSGKHGSYFCEKPAWHNIRQGAGTSEKYYSPIKLKEYGKCKD